MQYAYDNIAPYPLPCLHTPATNLSPDIDTTQLTVNIIPLTGTFAQAFDIESFLKFHDHAVSKCNGLLKRIEAIDLQSAAYAVIACDGLGNKKGQCLLFNASSDVKRIQPYLPYLQDPSNSYILTSLSGKKAIPPILETVLHTPLLGGKEICAKTNATNLDAKALFEQAGFTSEGPTTVQGDSYESYLYHGQNKVKIDVPTF